MEHLDYLAVGLLGLAVGSFLNVLIYRIPRRKKFWAGRSICPGCEGQLKWYHNVPLLSYLVLRGRCAFCRERISPRYLVVELLNCLAWLYFYWALGPTLNMASLTFVSSALLVVFFVDLDFQIIPDLVTFPGMVLGLAVSWLPGGIGLADAIIGLVFGGGSLYLVALLGDWLFKKESMGGGDIKLAAMLGSFLGWQKVLLVFISSAVIGLVVSLVLMLFSSRLRAHRVVPFGPFIAVAAMLAIIWGDEIIGYYVSHFLAFR